MEEIWKDVKGYESYYQVSSLGSVKSLGNNKFKKEKVLKFGKDKVGYCLVNLCVNGKVKMYKVHRLVALTFLENPENKPQVNHINAIKNDNRVENLEWNTYSENIRHAFDNGLNKGRKGEIHHKSKLTEKEVIKIREVYSTGSYSKKEIGVIFKVSQTQICRIVNRKNWSHI